MKPMQQSSRPHPFRVHDLNGIFARCKVDQATGCLEWRLLRTGGEFPRDRYPTCSFRGVKRRSGSVVWELVHGAAPAPGMEICHRCDNPPCCNPDHLFLGTHADNMRDMAAKKRQATNGRRGEGIALAVLTDSDVASMRRDRAAGMIYRELAVRYGCSLATAQKACVGSTWTHVPEPANSNLWTTRAA